MKRPLLTVALACWAASASAQTLTNRGFIEGRGFFFPQETTLDTTHHIGDFMVREEVFLKPAEWVQFAAGLDFRANTHEQVQDQWRIDFRDRTIQRPRIATRRLTATLTGGPFNLDVGKQFIRWGRADVLNPTDRFAPRDFINVIDNEFLPVLAARVSLQLEMETLEAVWVPELTPSRLPLLGQRWTEIPPGTEDVLLVDAGSIFPDDSQMGFRWNHSGEQVELSLSYFDGYNHLPNIIGEPVEDLVNPSVILTRVYPRLRSYGGDVAVPTRWATIKGEATYFTSPPSTNEEYVLYVIELERQAGEWIFVGGYAGEVVTDTKPGFPFAPDRGIAKSILGRASYTVDPRRTVAVEGALRQNFDGIYVKGEYSQAFGQYWRLTLTGVGIGGEETDFLGQYNRNSHLSAAMRFSF